MYKSSPNEKLFVSHFKKLHLGLAVVDLSVGLMSLLKRKNLSEKVRGKKDTKKNHSEESYIVK